MDQPSLQLVISQGNAYDVWADDLYVANVIRGISILEVSGSISNRELAMSFVRSREASCSRHPGKLLGILITDWSVRQEPRVCAHAVPRLRLGFVTHFIIYLKEHSAQQTAARPNTRRHRCLWNIEAPAGLSLLVAARHQMDSVAIAVILKCGGRLLRVSQETQLRGTVVRWTRSPAFQSPKGGSLVFVFVFVTVVEKRNLSASIATKPKACFLFTDTHATELIVRVHRGLQCLIIRERRDDTTR